jgi:DNA-cytosine methyltransferase
MNKLKKILKLLMSLVGFKSKTKKGINVVSLFDGASCAMLALKEMGISVNKYIASEVDVHAIKVSQKNHPEIIQVGDVKSLDYNKILEMCDGEIDLLIGGSPCQDLSIAKSNRKGLQGERSGLFWNYVEAKEKLRPKHFVLENVASMSADNKQRITDAMGVSPININSEKLSSQKRNRLYWTNINVKQPEDSKKKLKDILENGYTNKEKSYCIDANYFKGSNFDMYVKKSKRQIVFKSKKVSKDSLKEGEEVFMKKFVDGTEKMHKSSGKIKSLQLDSRGKKALQFNQKGFRKLTIVECERLQCMPDGYTNIENVSRTERYRMIGNGFTVSVIKHILKGAFNS